ncbi:LOW QUALITY PROTEIN: hypothetical protein Tsubulata_037200 [Turnera subulata]|uniref:Polygalacturonase n=1 Tax=Turnera subulata TaxID=218843 RepID=A0A9Q0FYI7_9ROSI|nr:LOW QUALITY PROTEIN: hypothetical protein Tsubulata_037200 [Turnera subulata]
MVRKDLHTTQLGFQVIFFILCISLFNLSIGYGQTTFSVMDYGAKGDGQTDDTQAFVKAWTAVCGAIGGTPTLQIPSGTFLLKPLNFKGPCKANNIHIQVLGKIVAPSTVSAWGETVQVIVGCASKKLAAYGPGSIDGQGAPWWAQKKCERPRALLFNGCNDLTISGLSFINSPRAHVVINDCTGVSVSNIKIIAPEDSPNTDGIDLSGTTNAKIFDSSIGTGDDCIAINGGCSNVNITNIACGPGHGISIGSLGDSATDDSVEEVHVQFCNFTTTQNGARIKTVPGGTGFARKITYDHIWFDGTTKPIVIDQHYCNGAKVCAEKGKAIAVSDITFTNMQGTFSNDLAIKLDCDSTTGCKNIRMEQINLTPLEPTKEAPVVCNNAMGESISVTPPVPCLSSGYGSEGSHEEL